LNRIESVDFNDNFQHGFRSSHGSLTACLEIQSYIASGLDNKKKVLVYSADMSAAFDLLRKENLFIPHVPNELNNIVMNFLTDRRAYVQIGKESSFLFDLSVGVPQGSVLGPKLFSIYTKDLDQIKQNGVNIVAYADDSYIICSAPELCELQHLATNTLSRHLEWLKKIGMVVNPEKTELVCFSKTGDDSITLTVDGQQLQSSSSMNILGTTFDNRLSWEPQLHRATRRCQSLKPALRILAGKLNRKEFLQIVTSHYYSNLYYCSELWFHPLPSRLKRKINLIHFFPLRLIMRDYKRELSYKTLCKKTQRASPSDLNDFKLAKCLISLSNNCAPFSLFQDLLVNVVVESRSPFRPWFLDTSRSRLGRQSFCNRVNNISKRLSFDWYGIDINPITVRRNLKPIFYKYLA